MKKLAMWGSIIGLSYLISSCSVAINQETIAEPEEPVMEISYEELEEQFVAEALSDAQLLAFENKAIDNLRDYIDYVNILHDDSMDSTFKAQAFTSLKSNIPAYKPLVYNDLLSTVSTHTKDKFSLKDIRIIEPLYSLQDFYTGQMGFVLSSANEGEFNQTIAFYVRKEVKQFGDTEEVLWNVSLGEINFKLKPDDK